MPTHATVKSPTHLTLRVAPKERPVETNQNHQGARNAWEGPISCWLVKQVNVNAVRAVKKTRGESKRIRRDWVMRPFSKRRQNPHTRCLAWFAIDRRKAYQK